MMFRSMPSAMPAAGLRTSVDGSRVYAFHGNGVTVLNPGGVIMGEIPLSNQYTSFTISADKRHAFAKGDNSSIAVIDLEHATATVVPNWAW